MHRACHKLTWIDTTLFPFDRLRATNVIPMVSMLEDGFLSLLDCQLNGSIILGTHLSLFSRLLGSSSGQTTRFLLLKLTLLKPDCKKH